MATWYVNSAAAGTASGTSWVNACLTIAAAITLSASGDDFNVLSTHAETQASNLTLTFKGTAASPNRVFSCGNTNSPAQASDLLAGASITTTAAATLAIAGYVYIFGVTFSCGSGANAPSLTIAGSSYAIELDTCALRLGGTTGGTIICGFDGTVSSYLSLANTTFQVASTAAGLAFAGVLVWKNTTSAITGATLPATLMTPVRGANIVTFDGVDLSAFGSGKTIVAATSQAGSYQFINCKFGSSVTVAGTPTQPGVFIDVINSDSGATGYRQERYQYAGTLTTSTSVYNNATDGVTPISWQVITTANAKRMAPFECFQIVQWAAAGTYAASLIQITSATASLLNSDIWVEIEYLGNASYPLASVATSGPATQLTTGSSLAAGTWATGGLGNNYKLAIPSFTTALAGYVRFTVKVAKASLTVNIDPDVTVA